MLASKGGAASSLLFGEVPFNGDALGSVISLAAACFFFVSY